MREEQSQAIETAALQILSKLTTIQGNGDIADIIKQHVGPYMGGRPTREQVMQAITVRPIQGLEEAADRVIKLFQADGGE